MRQILEIEDVSLSFGGLQVLRNVRLDVLKGNVTALIGPNGAGKTALLNCISGIYRPQSGRITFDGEDLIGRPPEQIARLGIARSFQNLELFPSLSVIENLLVARDDRFRGSVLGAALFWGPARRREIAEREAVERVIDFFELWPLRHVRAHDLPYGQQKIVGFARAMAADPKLLLLDEPGSGLTRDEKEDLARFILRLRFDWKVSDPVDRARLANGERSRRPRACAESRRMHRERNSRGSQARAGRHQCLCRRRAGRIRAEPCSGHGSIAATRDVRTRSRAPACSIWRHHERRADLSVAAIN